MSLPRFFLKTQSLEDVCDPKFELDLNPDDLHHFNVLRIKPPEHIAIIDSTGTYYECEVIEVSGEKPIVRIALRQDAKHKPFEITLFQGIAKQDKMDDIIRHCTEVGVDAFQPVAFSRCVKKLDEKRAKKMNERWSAIAESAAAQSGRRSIPEVYDVLSVSRLADTLKEYDAVVVFWEEADLNDTIEDALKHACEQIIQNGSQGCVSVALIIGPEGGIAPNEVDLILNNNPASKLSTLGEFIMRTETACIVACALTYSLLSKCTADLEAV